MTLAEMLAKPYPPNPLGERPSTWWLSDSEVPKLPPCDGRQPTAQETLHLLDWVLEDCFQAPPLVPESWREPLACLPLQRGLAELDYLGVRVIDRLGGAATFARLRELIAESGVKALGEVGPMLLLKLGGLAAIPLLAPEYSLKWLERDYTFAFEVVKYPGRLGLRNEIWRLLWEADGQKTLANLHSRGFAFTPVEIHALATHPVHGEALRGLVLAVRNERGELVRPFVLPEVPLLGPSESTVIAHASLLRAADRDSWTQRLTAASPFDQWAFQEKALDVSRCAADPLVLFTYLEARGWQRGPAIDGVIRTHSKAFPDVAVRAVVEYTGVPVNFGGMWTRQRITRCRFDPHESAIAATAVAEDLEGLAA